MLASKHSNAKQGKFLFSYTYACANLYIHIKQVYYYCYLSISVVCKQWPLACVLIRPAKKGFYILKELNNEEYAKDNLAHKTQNTWSL